VSDSPRTDELTLRRRGQFRFLFVALGVLVVGIFGYLGFLAFAQADRAAGSGVLVVGAVTGFAAFFSPCSFPLLLTFLARRGEESKRAALVAALRVGLGATALLALVALAMAIAGAAVGTLVQFDDPAGRIFRVIVGGVLIGLGLKQSRLVDFDAKWMHRIIGRAGQRLDRSSTSTRLRADFLYGFGFLLAGFG